MKTGDTGFLKGGSEDSITWIAVKVNVIRKDGSVTFQHFGGFQCWFLNSSEVKDLFYKRIPRDNT